MGKKCKYRMYVFGRGYGLIGIGLINRLPKNARKPVKGIDIWEVTERQGIWCKICRVDSDIDFGTGIVMGHE